MFDYLPQIKNLTKERAKKLIAVVSLTDAACYFDKDGTARWNLQTAHEKDLHQFVFDLFQLSFNIKLPTFYKDHNNYKTSGFNGKNYSYILNDLFQFSKSFKKFPSKSNAQSASQYLKEAQPNLDFIFDEPPWFKMLCLRTAMSLEGSIITKFMIKKKNYFDKNYYQFQFEPVLELACTHPQLVSYWKKLFNEINLNLVEKYDKRSWKGIIGLRTSNKESVIRFAQSGGFLFDIKIHKSPPTALVSNNSFSKQTILNTTIEILKNHQTSFHFSSMNEAKKFRVRYIRNIYLKIRDKHYGPARI